MRFMAASPWTGQYQYSSGTPRRFARPVWPLRRDSDLGERYRAAKTQQRQGNHEQPTKDSGTHFKLPAGRIFSLLYAHSSHPNEWGHGSGQVSNKSNLSPLFISEVRGYLPATKGPSNSMIVF